MSQYLSPHSDIVALMVLEHQTHAYNLLTQASFEVRHAQHVLDQATGDNVASAEQDVQQTITRSADLIAAGFLYANETRLTAPIQGTSEFTSEFASRGPKNSLGHSLREFDLKTRVFRFPCSHLIQSSYYQKLPAKLRDAAKQRMIDAITGIRPIAGQHMLTQEEQTAILKFLAGL